MHRLPSGVVISRANILRTQPKVMCGTCYKTNLCNTFIHIGGENVFMSYLIFEESDVCKIITLHFSVITLPKNGHMDVLV